MHLNAGYAETAPSALTVPIRTTTLTLSARGGIYNQTTFTFEDGLTITFEDDTEILVGDTAAGLSLPARALSLTLPVLNERPIA